MNEKDQYIPGKKKYPLTANPKFSEKRGVFVTLAFGEKELE